MAVPDMPSLMLPILELLADGRDWKMEPDLVDALASRLSLTEADLAEMRSDAIFTTFVARTQYAAAFMASDGLLERLDSGRVAITQRGRDLLATKPEKIDTSAPEDPEQVMADHFEAMEKKALADMLGTREPKEQQPTPLDSINAAIFAPLDRDLVIGPIRFAGMFEWLVIALVVVIGWVPVTLAASYRAFVYPESRLTNLVKAVAGWTLLLLALVWVLGNT